MGFKIREKLNWLICINIYTASLDRIFKVYISAIKLFLKYFVQNSILNKLVSTQRKDNIGCFLTGLFTASSSSS